MPFEVGGDKAWRRFRRGDLIAALHWVDHEPTMVLAAARGGAAYAVPLDRAHQYVKADGYPEPGHCAALARDVADHLGLGQDRGTLYRVAELFLDAVPDLLTMPPEPDWRRLGASARAGELVIKAGGRVVAEVEV